ncbi:26S proteasome non-ATPase regulatory subunit 1 [Platysternon megacephalum]|uniref:26S proteasome non-ATPase regulatory subunit 1 n=1 Tax=Platysternon megacephalum TaxID=55544 RepID=A0A4D9EDM5_9SAUR|nr:26S proteasome non-ATPase regulatory subunit 1 [Platysternon megacephalum]
MDESGAESNRIPPLPLPLRGLYRGPHAKLSGAFHPFHCHLPPNTQGCRALPLAPRAGRRARDLPDGVWLFWCRVACSPFPGREAEPPASGPGLARCADKRDSRFFLLVCLGECKWGGCCVHGPGYMPLGSPGPELSGSRQRNVFAAAAKSQAGWGRGEEIPTSHRSKQEEETEICCPDCCTHRKKKRRGQPGLPPPGSAQSSGQAGAGFAPAALSLLAGGCWVFTCLPPRRSPAGP